MNIMLNGVRILTNIKDVNSFDVVSTLDVRQGTDPLDFYIQLWQGDKGIRYVPVADVVVTIEFLRADTVGVTNTSRKVSEEANLVFEDFDNSIFMVSLTSAQVANITTGGFRVTVVETVNSVPLTKVVWSEMTIRKLPSSEIGV